MAIESFPNWHNIDPVESLAAATEGRGLPPDGGPVPQEDQEILAHAIGDQPELPTWDVNPPEPPELPTWETTPPAQPELPTWETRAPAPPEDAGFPDRPAAHPTAPDADVPASTAPDAPETPDLPPVTHPEPAASLPPFDQGAGVQAPGEVPESEMTGPGESPSLPVPESRTAAEPGELPDAESGTPAQAPSGEFPGHESGEQPELPVWPFVLVTPPQDAEVPESTPAPDAPRAELPDLTPAEDSYARLPDFAPSGPGDQPDTSLPPGPGVQAPEADFSIPQSAAPEAPPAQAPASSDFFDRMYPPMGQVAVADTYWM